MVVGFPVSLVSLILLGRCPTSPVCGEPACVLVWEYLQLASDGKMHPRILGKLGQVRLRESLGLLNLDMTIIRQL
jgi:hypothetical protein